MFALIISVFIQLLWIGVAIFCFVSFFLSLGG